MENSNNNNEKQQQPTKQPRFHWKIRTICHTSVFTFFIAWGVNDCICCVNKLLHHRGKRWAQVIKILAQAPCVVAIERARANSQMHVWTPVLTSPQRLECWQKRKVTRSFEPSLVNSVWVKRKIPIWMKMLASDVRALSHTSPCPCGDGCLVYSVEWPGLILVLMEEKKKVSKGFPKHKLHYNYVSILQTKKLPLDFF